MTLLCFVHHVHAITPYNVACKGLHVEAGQTPPAKRAKLTSPEHVRKVFGKKMKESIQLWRKTDSSSPRTNDDVAATSETVRSGSDSGRKPEEDPAGAGHVGSDDAGERPGTLAGTESVRTDENDGEEEKEKEEDLPEHGGTGRRHSSGTSREGHRGERIEGEGDPSDEGSPRREEPSVDPLPTSDTALEHVHKAHPDADSLCSLGMLFQTEDDRQAGMEEWSNATERDADVLPLTVSPSSCRSQRSGTVMASPTGTAVQGAGLEQDALGTVSPPGSTVQEEQQGAGLEQDASGQTLVEWSLVCPPECSTRALIPALCDGVSE